MPKALKHTKTTVSKNLFPVIGIGASAGGLEAFKKFIRAIPQNSGMAYILVQHLHPEHNSSLPEILQRETKVKVEEVSDNVIVKPNRVYIIPANKLLIANDGVLRLSPRPKDKKNMPVDIFFSSLAEVHQNHAIGIILSGTGEDGTAGLKKIKDHGGITMAQDSISAAFDDMPQNAIRSEVVDFILSPEEMPRQLLDLEKTLKRIGEDGTAALGQVLEEESFRNIIALLRVRNGADFTYYKQTTVRRRILRRVAILKLEKIDDYLKYLKNNKAEQDILFQDLLIPVTGFFRDPKTFEYLSGKVFPELIKNIPIALGTPNPLRIWIAGCSTGEEAYSMGICLYEYLGNKTSATRIQIFATDISEQSIAKARSGIYGKRQLEGVSESRLQQFFTKTDGHYQIKKNIRDLCVFASHNFLKDPPFAKIDLVTCRNVLIYMEPFLQKKALTTFHYALNEKGYLLLGKSETAAVASDFFLTADSREKIYTRKSLTGRFMNVTSMRKEEALKDKDYGVRSNERKKDDFQKNAEDILLSKYTPAGVIVNEQFDIVQFRGSTGPYLEPSPGKASLNVLKMAREGLSFELRNGLHKSKSSGKPFSKGNIPLYDGKKLVTIDVIPLPETIDPHFLILFKDTQASQSQEQYEAAVSQNETGNKNKRTTDRVKDARITQLEKDLAQAREDMRSIAEDQEAANEELQSANEELLSGSEELQTLNEELETSKEELQSTNEELITVNQELYDRNEQLNQARMYAEGIVTTIHESMLVLTADFSVKNANNTFYETFSLTEKDTLGKNIFELQNNGWNIPDLRKNLLKLQEKKEKFLEWEITYKFPAAGERTICFNAQPIPEENDRHLILLALDDITPRREAEKIHTLQNLKQILESIPQITFSASSNGGFTYFNNFFLDYSGVPLKKALGSGWLSVINADQYDKALKAWNHSIRTLENFYFEFQLRRKSDGMYRWHLCRANAIINDEGTVTSWVGTATDIDEQKSKEKAKDEFISMASHELKTPITTAKAFLQLVEHGMDGKNKGDAIYVKKASGAIDKLNNLVSELLDVTKIQHGILGFNILLFNINKTLRDVIESIQVTDKKHKIILSGEIKKKVKGDEERIKQVVINLLTNAVKYSPGADKILVDILQEDGSVKVSVKDFGVGISKKNLNKIFDRYYREEGQAGYFQGLGIGLSITKEIISRHNGKIWAESDPGKGSTFYFTLPI
ncbi:MAG: chemotaxis protein CheB [Ginsengibacter sp.]